MARIDALPSIKIIRGLKGILDFYVWKGLPCVRAWPRYRPAKQTAASLAAALVFGAIVKSYGLLGDLPLEAYRNDALDQTRTARDIMVTGVYGNLHEASMSDFLDLLVECRDFLSDLTALLEALHSIDTDEIVVRTEHSVLPDGAATSAAQATQLTALQKLDDLQDALQSKALDRLLVRGSNQLFSFAGVLAKDADGLISGANGFFDSPAVPAGQIWIVTTIAAVNVTSPVTAIILNNQHDARSIRLQKEIKAFAIDDYSSWTGFTSLDQSDVIRAEFIGGQAGDTCAIFITGHIMTLET
ncbi:MAG: hypothetical protein E3J25_11965 [Anaerolineales bacterium]|nr:MAG: hypothetical protein E3J25_11965 [Anaerolineales bacterium]